LRDDAEAEDVMQDAYVRAYQHLHQFAARAPFSAWLTSIAVHEALGRLRLRKQNPQLDDTEQEGEFSMNLVETSPNPEQSASRAELGQLLEEALLDLPEQYRTVVMLRDVEELSTSEYDDAFGAGFTWPRWRGTTGFERVFRRSQLDDPEFFIPLVLRTGQ
jgi:RNA polymerase sigma-70 factor (ECF subfamily)